MKKLSRLVQKALKEFDFLKAARLLFYTFVFFLPFNINLLVYTTDVFNTGNFNTYTSFFVYLCDFLFIFALIFWAVSAFRKQFTEKFTYGNSFLFILLVLFLILAEISVVFSQEKVISILLLIRLGECLLLYFFTVNKVVTVNTVINVFIASVSLQAFLAILQFLFHGSLGLEFLGESLISPVTTGVAKIDLLNETIVRPYGTFPHSNLLAGYLVTSIFLTFYRVLNKEHIAFPLLFLQIGALVLTFSRAAFIALIIGWLVYISVKNTKIPYKLIFLIVCSLILFVVIFNLEELLLNRVLFNDMTSLNDRVFYFNISKAMLVLMPFGIGLGNFTLMMQDFTFTKLAPWDFQPVHNIYLLIANEIGLPGLIIFLSLLIAFGVLIFIKMKKSHNENKRFGVILLCILSSYLVIGLFDHYLFSLYQGLMLSFFIFSLSGRYITEESR